MVRIEGRSKLFVSVTDLYEALLEFNICPLEISCLKCNNIMLLKIYNQNGEPKIMYRCAKKNC
ncbi:hypothetical protein ENBRE01_3389 [Enteropsectra breve]|nr:hypothetical protein ENBRE01_3389 [Enteropsectra breve]